jgi:salicylate 5-hydroxylase small subunit
MSAEAHPTTTASPAAAPPALDDPALWMAVQNLLAEVASALDQHELDRWPGFFTADCIYRLQSRENFDRGLPLATMAFESRGMLMDRVYGAQDTIYHDPYHQRHILGAPRILTVDDAGIRCESSYLVVRTKRDALPEILSVGRYLDRLVHTPEGLRIAERLAIFDNDLIPNSIVDPV